MTSKLSQVVFTVFLWVLLPLPIWQSQLGWLPVMEQWRYVLSVGTWLLPLQVVVNQIICVALALIYGRISRQWPMKIRGAVVGLLVLSLVILVSTWSLYVPLGGAGVTRLELREIYR